MKKTLALLVAAATLALPVSAMAHRAWIAPTSTVLSGPEAWVGFDAGLSNGVFIADHAAMNLTGLRITAPDGTSVEPQNIHRAHYRSSFDVHLTQQGTYKIANVMSGTMASWTENGEQKRWRGPASELSANVPAGGADLSVTQTFNRIETFVTLGAPTTTVFTDPGEGLVMIPITHPTDLVADEEARFRLSFNGQPAAGIEVTVARGGSRYRDAPEEFTTNTGADGTFTLNFAEPGLHWINAQVRNPANGDTPATNAQYVGVVEVLP